MLKNLKWFMKIGKIKNKCSGAHPDLCLSFIDCEIRKNESEKRHVPKFQ